METFNHWTLLIVTIIVLLVFLLGYYLYRSNKRILRKKGYNEDYIRTIRKELLNTVLGISLVVPLSLIASGYIVSLIYGKLDIRSEYHLFILFVFFIILISPFPVISYYKSKRKYRELAMKTGEKIFIDFNFSLLHRIFNPILEITATILYLGTMLLMDLTFNLAFIHLALLWLLYGLARNAKYQVKASLKDTYMYVFIFLGINHVLLIYYLVRQLYTFQCGNCLVRYLAVALALLLSVKLLYYIFNLSIVERKLSED